MLQANAAASVLDFMMPQAGVTNRGSTADPGAFSQHFEKQVKNISNANQGNSGQTAAKTNKSLADSLQPGEKTDPQAVANDGKVDESKDDEGGNILPQLPGVDDDLLSEAIRQVLESPPEATPEEDLIPVLPLPIATTESELVLDDESGEEDLIPVLPLPIVMTESELVLDDESGEEDVIPVLPLPIVMTETELVMDDGAGEEDVIPVLPLPIVMTESELVLDDESSEEDVIPVLPLPIVMTESELVLDDESGEEDVIPVLPLPIAMTETELVLDDESGEEVLSQSLRDFLRQRPISGLEQELPTKRAAMVLEPAALAAVSRSSVSTELGSALAPLSATAGSSPGTAPVPALAPQASLPAHMTLSHPMQQQKGWDQAMGQRVVWMVRNNMQEAQIQLNPRDLGPINVRISVNNDQANVHFVAQHATTREALENAMPRLREMMHEAGLNLAQSDVSRQSHGQGDHASGGGRGGLGQAQAGEEGELEQPVKHTAHMALGGVDFFA